MDSEIYLAAYMGAMQDRDLRREAFTLGAATDAYADDPTHSNRYFDGISSIMSFLFFGLLNWTGVFLWYAICSTLLAVVMHISLQISWSLAQRTGPLLAVYWREVMDSMQRSFHDNVQMVFENMQRAFDYMQRVFDDMRRKFENTSDFLNQHYLKLRYNSVWDSISFRRQQAVHWLSGYFLLILIGSAAILAVYRPASAPPPTRFVSLNEAAELGYPVPEWARLASLGNRYQGEKTKVEIVDAPSGSHVINDMLAANLGAIRTQAFCSYCRQSRCCERH